PAATLMPMRSVAFKILAFCLTALSAGRASAATNVVSGTLTNNTTLTGTNLLQGTVVVTNGVALTIDPGTKVMLNTNATLLVYGQLLANGTSNAPISFTRYVTGQ